MKELKLKVKNETGFHARPASELVSLASKYQSDIIIHKREKTANLKSILGLLSLGIAKNDEVVIQIEGVDEDQALTGISQFGKKSELW
jgi:phosphocarrier protein